jgi:hypothetical protein
MWCPSLTISADVILPYSHVSVCSPELWLAYQLRKACMKVVRCGGKGIVVGLLAGGELMVSWI